MYIVSNQPVKNMSVTMSSMPRMVAADTPIQIPTIAILQPVDGVHHLDIQVASLKK